MRRPGPAPPARLPSWLEGVRGACGGLPVAVREHPRHLVLGALVAGLVLCRAPAPVVVAAAIALAGLARRPVPAALAGLAVLVGASGGALRLDALEAGRLAAASGRFIQSRAVLLEPVRVRAPRLAVVRAELTAGVARGEQAVMRVRAPAPREGWPGVGEEVRVAGVVAPLGRYDAYQRLRGAHAAVDVARIPPTGAVRRGLAGAVDALRRRAEHALTQGLRPSEAALLRGMVLGEDERLAAPVREDFRRSGLAHVLAVSGQNVMLLAALVLALGAATGLPIRPRLGAALLLIAVYVPLAGGGPSIQRAGVMGAAGLVAALAGRPASRWYALGLAAAVTLGLNPRACADPGWQLSFAAVVSLLALAPRLRERLRRRLPAALAEVTAITLAASVGTAPLLALHFGQVSVAGLAANLLAAPLIGPVMWLGMLAVALGQVAPDLAIPFTVLAAPALVALQQLAHVAAWAPLAVLDVRLGSLAGVAAAYGLLAVAVTVVAAITAGGRPAGLRARGPRRAAGLAVGALGVAGLAILLGSRTAPRPVPGELLVSFLDVGQGDATLLQRDGVAVLFDTGPPDGPILRRLAESGIERLDALVLTHAQADHEGAAPAVLRRYRPRLVLDGGSGWRSAVQRALPAAAAAAGARQVAPVAGDVIRTGALRLRVLWPPRAPSGWRPEGDPNDRAVVALVSSGPFKLLLTADAESGVLSHLALPRVDVLKVAHHGSEDSGLPALLARLRPRVAAIEVGRRNSYGHPAPSTLAALRRVPVVRRTDRDGTIRLRVRGRRVTVESA